MVEIAEPCEIEECSPFSHILAHYALHTVIFTVAMFTHVATLSSAHFLKAGAKFMS